MTAKEYLKKTIKKHEYDDGFCFQEIRPRAVCKDGFSVSIQASRGHYCTPREDFLEDYDTVELGYPSEGLEELADYAEDEDLTKTVYAQVPIEILEKIISKHGGIIN